MTIGEPPAKKKRIEESTFLEQVTIAEQIAVAEKASTVPSLHLVEHIMPEVPIEARQIPEIEAAEPIRQEAVPTVVPEVPRPTPPRRVETEELVNQ